MDIKTLREYIADGRRVFPLHAWDDAALELKKRGKLPLISKWQETAAGGFEEFRFQQREAGCALDPDDLVVDVDRYKFPPGFNSYDQLCKDIGCDLAKAATVKVLTGGGGEHYYFKKPVGFPIMKTHKNYPGIEFLSSGMFVVCAGARHHSGNVYRFTPDSLELHECSQAPAALLDILHHENRTWDEAGAGGYFDTPVNMRRAIDQLSKHEQAIEGRGGDGVTLKAAYICRDNALSPRVALQILLDHYNPRCMPPWSSDELKTKILNAYNYAKRSQGWRAPEAVFSVLPQEEVESGAVSLTADNRGLVDWKRSLIRDEKHRLKPNSFQNTMIYLRNDEKLIDMVALNSFTGTVSMVSPAPWLFRHDPDLAENFPATGREWSDEDSISLRAYLNSIWNYDVGIQIIDQCVQERAQENMSHPVVEYLKQLEWDGEERLATWMHDYLGAKDCKYTSDVGTVLIHAMVSRVMRPGCKFDYMVILEGLQGTRKSTALQILGGAWFTDTLPTDIRDKDTVDGLRGIWLCEFGELAALTRTENNDLKKFISSQVDRMRPSYGKRTKNYPRQCVFVGSTNKDNYLKDETGGRRFMPIRCKKIDTDGLAAVRDQLFAEAMVAYAKGEAMLYLSDEESMSQALAEQKDRTNVDPWTPNVRKYLEGKEETSIIEIWSESLQRTVGTLTRFEQARLDAVLIHLDWHREGEIYVPNRF